MKKVWTVLLAVFGFGGDAFADCYSEAMNFSGEQMEEAVDYCLESEIERLREIQRQFQMANHQKRLVLMKEARSIKSGWELDDYIILANGICTACVDGDDKPK